MSEVKLANIDGKELRRELEILFEDKEKRVFFMQMLATSVKETNELLNVVTLMLESPEILQNPDDEKEPRCKENASIHLTERARSADKGRVK